MKKGTNKEKEGRIKKIEQWKEQRQTVQKEIKQHIQ